jgi:hypothetical protein
MAPQKGANLIHKIISASSLYRKEINIFLSTGAGKTRDVLSEPIT